MHILMKLSKHLEYVPNSARFLDPMELFLVELLNGLIVELLDCWIVDLLNCCIVE